MFCDVHCHSKKRNSFIYGCHLACNEGFTSWTKVRLLPRILGHFTHLFSYKDCRFKIQGNKEGTARVVAWKEFGITNAFTLETSFYGYSIGPKTIQYNKFDYAKIGRKLGESVQEYSYMLKQIEKELCITNGWLKPKLLIEITGSLANDKMTEEYEKVKRLAIRKKKIEEYEYNLRVNYNGVGPNRGRSCTMKGEEIIKNPKEEEEEYEVNSQIQGKQQSLTINKEVESENMKNIRNMKNVNNTNKMNNMEVIKIRGGRVMETSERSALPSKYVDLRTNTQQASVMNIRSKYVASPLSGTTSPSEYNRMDYTNIKAMNMKSIQPNLQPNPLFAHLNSFPCPRRILRRGSSHNSEDSITSNNTNGTSPLHNNNNNIVSSPPLLAGSPLRPMSEYLEHLSAIKKIQRWVRKRIPYVDSDTSSISLGLNLPSERSDLSQPHIHMYISPSFPKSSTKDIINAHSRMGGAKSASNSTQKLMGGDTTGTKTKGEYIRSNTGGDGELTTRTLDDGSTNGEDTHNNHDQLVGSWIAGIRGKDTPDSSNHKNWREYFTENELDVYIYIYI